MLQNIEFNDVQNNCMEVVALQFITWNCVKY